jgi:hypothetical protein
MICRGRGFARGVPALVVVALRGFVAELAARRGWPVCKLVIRARKMRWDAAARPGF